VGGELNHARGCSKGVERCFDVCVCVEWSGEGGGGVVCPSGGTAAGQRVRARREQRSGDIDYLAAAAPAAAWEQNAALSPHLSAMGSNCSSRQAHKDKDSNSPCSEE